MVLKLGRLIARATGVCTRDRGNWEALTKLEGRTARVARRKREVEAMTRGVGVGQTDHELGVVEGNRDRTGCGKPGVFVTEVEVRGNNRLRPGFCGWCGGGCLRRLGKRLPWPPDE